MVVAHPDDESLFGGATLLEGGWKVICITNGNRPVRRAEFEKVMELTKSEFEMWSYYDQFTTPLADTLEDDLIKVVNQGWDKIVTHNQKGEYGHPHHIQVHNILSKITNNNLWTFNFNGPDELPPDIWQAKLNLIHIYESQKHICDGHIPSVKNERIVKQKAFF